MATSTGVNEGRAERGAVLLIALVFAVILALGAASVLTTSRAISDRVIGEAKVGRAGGVGETGLTYLCEQWRANPTLLDINDQNGDGQATTALENSQVGVVRSFGGGTFRLLTIEDVNVGPTVIGKVVTVEASHDGNRYSWRALLSPNLVSPIQGVGTIQNQWWRGTAEFGSLGNGRGSCFGNGSLTISGTAQITGEVTMSGNVTQQNQGTINGAVDDAAPPIQFPNQTQIINAVVDFANNSKPAGYWSNPKATLVQSQAVTAMEVIDANPSTLGSGWSSANTPNMKHLMIRGGTSRLPAGNYAFGRLWLDNAVLTIESPPGGGYLVMPDVYLTNGARLIIDTRNGPLTVVTGENNAFEGTLTATNAQRWDTTTNAWVNSAPSLKLDGTTTSHIWNRTGGNSTGVKPDRGTGSGYDDWTLKDGSIFAVVTPTPNDKGFEMYMQRSTDLVLANGSRLMAGVQPTDLAGLQARATTMPQIDAMGQNAMGFLVWSGGGDLPRLNINAGAGAGGLPSSMTGLTYGGFEGTIGVGGSLTGAFVGYSMDCSGSVSYDSRLASLLTGPADDTEHVVVKRRPGR